MISGFPNALYGRAGRDEEIESVKASLRAAGKAGIPVVEYNFYAHRLTEGYYEEPGRGGAGMTAYDYERSRNLPPLPEVGTHTLDAMWANATYFLKAVVPAAESAGVRLALHPNDPPAPMSRGSQQIMATLEGWKRLVMIVDSPANGITFDCGVTRELGEDPVEVCRWFGERDRINHVHYRNVRVRKPYVDYTEVFLDEGQVDMFAVMKELVRQKYPRGIYPEHPRAMDYDRERGIKRRVPRRRRVRGRGLQRRLHEGDAAGGAVGLSASLLPRGGTVAISVGEPLPRRHAALRGSETSTASCRPSSATRRHALCDTRRIGCVEHSPAHLGALASPLPTAGSRAALVWGRANPDDEVLPVGLL